MLFFGLLRPYKGLDVLLEAWRGIDDAELWIVGMPRMDIAALRAAAPPSVRWVPRFVADDELAAYFAPRRPRRAALPRDRPVGRAVHRARLRQAAARLSDVGGFAELAAARRRARRRRPATPRALHDALAELLGDPAALAALGERALALAPASTPGTRSPSARSRSTERLLEPR